MAALFIALYSLRSGQRSAARVLAAIFGLAWLNTAWLYFLNYYQTLNVGAVYFAYAFMLQAALFLFIVYRPDIARLNQSAGPLATAGRGMLALCFIGYPLLAILTGRPWQQFEMVALTPDPTVLATLGLLLTTRARGALILWPIPFFWCVLSGTTLWVLLR